MIESFEIFTKYCQKTGRNIQVRNHAYCLFVTALKKTLEEHEANNGAVAKPKEIADKKSALLNEESIESFVTRAETIVEEAAIKLRAPYEKAFKTKQFFSSVGASVLAGFIYSVLLVIFFWLGKEQLQSWLQQLVQNG